MDLLPHKIMLKRKPDVLHLRALGCIAYTRILEGKWGKLDAHTMKGVLVGYYGNAAYRISYPLMHNIVKLCDVVFEEGCGHRMITVVGESSITTDLVPTPLIPTATATPSPITAIAPVYTEICCFSRIPKVPTNASTSHSQNPFAYIKGYCLGKAVTEDVTETKYPLKGNLLGLLQNSYLLPSPLKRHLLALTLHYGCS